MSSVACACGSPSIMRTGGPSRRQLHGGDRHLRDDRRRVESEAGEVDRLDRLLLRRHDPLEARVARLVQALLGRHERRERGLPRLAPAVDLALDRGLSFPDVDLDRHRHLRQVEQLRQHARDLAVVAPHPLLPAQDEVDGREGPDRGGERARRAERVGGVERGVLDVDGGVRAHGEARAQGGLRPLGTGGDEDDLAAALLLDPQRLLDRELVVGGDDPVGHVRLGDGGAGGRDLDPRLGVRDLLHADDDLHGYSLLRPRSA